MCERERGRGYQQQRVEIDRVMRRAPRRVTPWSPLHCTHTNPQYSCTVAFRCYERAFFFDNLLVRIHCIIDTLRWTGLAPWEFEFLFPASLTSAFLIPLTHMNKYDVTYETRLCAKVALCGSAGFSWVWGSSWTNPNGGIPNVFAAVQTQD